MSRRPGKLADAASGLSGSGLGKKVDVDLPGNIDIDTDININLGKKDLGVNSDIDANIDGKKVDGNVDGKKADGDVDGKKADGDVDGKKTDANVDGKKKLDEALKNLGTVAKIGIGTAAFVLGYQMLNNVMDMINGQDRIDKEVNKLEECVRKHNNNELPADCVRPESNCQVMKNGDARDEYTRDINTYIDCLKAVIPEGETCDFDEDTARGSLKTPENFLEKLMITLAKCPLMTNTNIAFMVSFAIGIMISKFFKKYAIYGMLLSIISLLGFVYNYIL